MQTRLRLIRELLAGTNPDQPVAVSDHGHPTHTPENLPNEDLPRDEEEWESEASSKKPYDEPPSFDPTYDEDVLKQIARMEYAREENMPELEASDNDVPGEHNPGKTRRRIADTPEDDYPEPIGGGDMRLKPEENVYWGKISHRLKNQTPDEYLEERTATIWLLEIARCKERHAEILAARGNAVNNEATVEQGSPVKDEDDKSGSSPHRP